MKALWYYIALNLARAAFWLIGGVKGIDSGNLPPRGPVIVAPLHVSHLDPPAVACGTNRRLRFMAKEELFVHRFFGALIRSLGAFPVKRGEGDSEAIRATIASLEKGEAVLIFPEGTRGDGKHIQPLSRGVAMLAKRTGAPVVPVGIIGTHRAWPRGQKKIKRAKIRIVFGEPFTYLSVATAAGEREKRELFLGELQSRIIQLCAREGLVLEPGKSFESEEQQRHPSKRS